MLASLMQTGASLSPLLEPLLPAMPYLAAMMSLLLTLALFLALKWDLQKFIAKARKHAVRERQRVDHLSGKLDDLAVRPLPVAEPVYIPVAAPAGFQLTGFNVNRRVQALRLLRRGEDTAHIAAALGVARQEIELLIRVQTLVAHAVRPVPQVSANDQAAELTESRADMPIVPVGIVQPLDPVAPRDEPPLEPRDGSSVDMDSLELKPTKPANVGTIRRRKIAVLA